jgi:hypothetical protein
MLLDKIVVGKKLPIEQSYFKEKEEIDFFRLSYEASGVDYTLGTCPDGDIIPKFSCEESQDWAMRRKLTPTRSYVSSIIQKYNSSIFRNEPSRATESDLYDQLLEDADGNGNTLNWVMKEALKNAQIDGKSYLYTHDDVEELEVSTVAQRNSANIRSYITIIKADGVVAIEETDNRIIEAVIILQDSEGKNKARYLNDSIYFDIEIDKNTKVLLIGDEIYHGYSSIPLTQLKPLEVAQSKPISYSQRTIVNILSLLHQEISDHTFSKYVLSGVRLPQDENAPRLTYGSKRMIVLEDQGAKLDVLGSQVDQAESLRNQIKLEEDNLYYSAGFGNQNLDPTNMSGFALSILKDDFFQTCDALKSDTEDAENYIVGLIGEKEGFDYIPAIYSSRFIADDGNTELSKLRDALALNLPSRFKQLLILDYLNKFYNISSEDRAIIEEELKQI